MGTRFGRTLLGVASVAALGLTACGGSSGSGSSGSNGGSGEASKDAMTIFNDASATLKAAKSVHVKANLTGTTPLTMDVVYNTTPAGDQGTISVGGFDLNIVNIGGKLFIKSPGYWASKAPDSATAAQLGNNWVMSSSTDPASGFLPATFADNLTGSGGTVSKGDQSTVNGVAVIALNSADGVMYVATSGTPYVIEIKKNPSASSTTAGTIDFSEYDNTVAITPPPGALDPNNLPPTAPTP